MIVYWSKHHKKLRKKIIDPQKMSNEYRFIVSINILKYNDIYVFLDVRRNNHNYAGVAKRYSLLSGLCAQNVAKCLTSLLSIS